jgi:hypothetical protein
MRRALVFAAVLAVAVGLPVIAYSRDGTIPLDLTFTTPEEDEGNGTINGTFGGVPVTGTFTGDEDSGDWILTVDGQPFSSGTYTCGDGGCVFTATTLMDRPRTFEFTTSGLNGTSTGSLQGLFRNHGGWVSTVARWANTNLGPGRVGKIVSSAARLGGAKVQGNAAKIQGSSGKVQDTSKVQRNTEKAKDTTKIQRNTEKAKDSTKIQGNPARAGKAGGRIDTRGQSGNARAGSNGKAEQANDPDKKGRGDDVAGQGNGRGQGNGGAQASSGGQGNGGGHGNGNGNDGGNGNGGGKGKD